MRSPLLRKLPKFTRNFYFLVSLFFLVWMLFFDSNDIFSQYKLRKKLKTLEAEKEYYEAKVGEVKLDREELFSNEELLEKFAREKYLMKKPEEDIFIIVEE